MWSWQRSTHRSTRKTITICWEYWIAGFLSTSTQRFDNYFRMFRYRFDDIYCEVTHSGHWGGRGPVLLLLSAMEFVVFFCFTGGFALLLSEKRSWEGGQVAVVDTCDTRTCFRTGTCLDLTVTLHFVVTYFVDFL